MKKTILIAILSLALTSCITQRPGIKETYTIDYKRYFDDGFFLTESNSVSFEYIPLGSVFATVKGSPKQDTPLEPNSSHTTKRSARDRRDGASLSSNFTKSSKYTIYDALDELVNESRRIGADGIINLQIIYTYDANYGSGYNISGMAISRNNISN